MIKSSVFALTACILRVLAQGPVQVIHEGESTGEIKTIDGINIYHAYPKNMDANMTIIYLTDIYGVQLPQNRLLADSFAIAGYTVLIPDYFKGEPIPVDDPAFDRKAWQSRHPQDEITGMIEKTIKYARDTLKAQRIGAAGYCFGGPYVVRLLSETNKEWIDAGFIAHPGAMTDKEINEIADPISIAAAETDMSFNASRRREVVDLLTKKNAIYGISLYSKVKHGFAVRANTTSRMERFAKEGAFWQALLWFDEWMN